MHSLPGRMTQPASVRSDAMGESTRKYWLVKAEPGSRLVKGRDVKFSVDDFESLGSTPWEGVRNYEARNLMKEMALGDKILFYHSNCKNPGIAGFAEVCKEAYPDHTAWDSAHPYFDEKTDRNNPKWFMVDAQFVSRAQHFVPLSLLRHLADHPSANPPKAISYVGEDGIDAIKAMPLITRGRLSVQRVPEKCWDVIQTMAEKGGWDNLPFEKKSTQTHRTVERSGVRHDEDIKRGKKRKASKSVSLEGEGQSLRRKSFRGKR